MWGRGTGLLFHGFMYHLLINLLLIFVLKKHQRYKKNLWIVIKINRSAFISTGETSHYKKNQLKPLLYINARERAVHLKMK